MQVVLLGRHGSRIREHILGSPVSERLTIEFIDLGEDWSGFYAQSLLAARDRCVMDLNQTSTLCLCFCQDVVLQVLVLLRASTPTKPWYHACRASMYCVGLHLLKADALHA
jgi:hypothetical protein